MERAEAQLPEARRSFSFQQYVKMLKDPYSQVINKVLIALLRSELVIKLQASTSYRPYPNLPLRPPRFLAAWHTDLDGWSFRSLIDDRQLCMHVAGLARIYGADVDVCHVRNTIPQLLEISEFYMCD